MILIWGLAQDPSTRAVWNWLSRWNAKAFFLNHADIYRTEVSMTTEPRLSFEVTCGNESCRLEELSAAYLRPYNYHEYRPPEFPSQPPSNPVMVHHLISAWAEYSPALVIGRPSAEAASQSKLYQAGEIRASGFLTPESLVTNDAEAVRDFRARHGSLICTSISNVRWVAKGLTAQEAAEEDTAEEDTEEMEGTAPGPVRFQQRIAGQYVRVHVVGEECFAQELPGEVARRAVGLTQRLGLYFAGLDLIRTAAGNWYCLNASPNPAFTCFDDGDAVAQALARMLMAAPEPALLKKKTARPPLNGAGPMGRNYAVLREEIC